MNDSRHPSRHFVVGVVVLLLGLVLLLDELGFTEANRIFRFWPLILIYFGLHKLLDAGEMVGRFWGGFLALLGLSFLMEELGFSYIRLGTIWPVFLICVGALLIMRRYQSRNAPPYYPPPPPPPGPEPPGAPGTEPPGADSSPSVPGVDVSASVPPGNQPPPANPPPGQASQESQAPPGAQARSQTPPWDPSAYPGWDANNWRHQEAWRRFEEKMNRMSERLNRKWGPGSNWAPDPGQQPNFNWQSRSNWQSDAAWYASTQSRLDEVNIFWGGRKRIVSKSFTGGEIVSIFGGFEIDLTEADIQGGEAKLDIVAIFGGGEVRVPRNWHVVLKTVGIFGGASDRTVHPQQDGSQLSAAGASVGPAVKTLIIDGVSLFGGVGIKN